MLYIPKINVICLLYLQGKKRLERVRTHALTRERERERERERVSERERAHSKALLSA